MNKKLSKAQQRLLDRIESAPERDTTGRDYWHQMKREADGTVYVPKEWQGTNLVETMRCLKEKGRITYRQHPEYTFAWLATVVAD